MKLQTLITQRQRELNFALYDTIFTPQGQTKVQFSWPELLSLSPEELIDLFNQQLKPFYLFQQLSLDSQLPTGFNDHGPNHINQVMKRSLSLCRWAKLDPHQQQLVVIAAAFHDLGNIIHRKQHNRYSLMFVQQLIPDLPEGPDKHEIEQAILYHDEQACTLEQVKQLPAIALALIIADKSDISLYRVSQTSNQPQALADPHVVVNLLVNQSQLLYQPPRMILQLEFNPNQEQRYQMHQLMKQSGRKMVPEQWRELYRNLNIEYIFIFYAYVLRIYLIRLELMIHAIWQLFPDVTEFVLDTYDPERFIRITREFPKQHADQLITVLKQHLSKYQL